MGVIRKGKRQKGREKAKPRGGTKGETLWDPREEEKGMHKDLSSANAVDETIILHAIAGTRKRRAISVERSGMSKQYAAKHNPQAKTNNLQM
jgi:hypothetical protein